MVLVPPNSRTVTSRVQALETGLGFISETPPGIGTQTGTTILVSGEIHATALGLRAGDVVTNVLTWVSVGGSAQTLVRLGLYSAALVLLGQTADAKAAYTGTGILATALATPVTITTDGLYYCAIIGVGGTQPTLGRQNATTSPPAFGANPLPFGRQTGQSDLTNPIVMTNTAGAMFWFAVT